MLLWNFFSELLPITLALGGFAPQDAERTYVLSLSFSKGIPTFINVTIVVILTKKERVQGHNDSP